VDLSYDGSVIVGSCDILSQTQACRWSPSTGFERLGFLPTDSVDQFSAATEVSADGNVIIGFSSGDFAKQKAFRWTPQTGMMPFDALRPGVALGPGLGKILLSADGSILVGIGPDGTLSRWTEAGGTQSLGFIGTAHGVSGDGSRIVGIGTFGDENRPFIWDAALGVRNLHDVLTNDYGLGPAIGDWTISEAYGISNDGRTIVGQAKWLGGNRDQAYAAVVPLPSVPEPSTFVLVAFGSAWFGIRRR
jgi:probable HAF family extracellular repeat protein